MHTQLTSIENKDMKFLFLKVYSIVVMLIVMIHNKRTRRMHYKHSIRRAVCYMLVSNTHVTVDNFDALFKAYPWILSKLQYGYKLS